jgi:hypothetical protein
VCINESKENMKTQPILFQSKIALERAHDAGQLKKGVHYQVAGQPAHYRLSVARKGLAEIMHRG